MAQSIYPISQLLPSLPYTHNTLTRSNSTYTSPDDIRCTDIMIVGRNHTLVVLANICYQETETQYTRTLRGGHIHSPRYSPYINNPNSPTSTPEPAQKEGISSGKATLEEDEEESPPEPLVSVVPSPLVLVGFSSFVVQLKAPLRTLVPLLFIELQSNLEEDVSIVVAPLTKLSLFRVTLKC